MASSHGRVSKVRLDVGVGAESNGMRTPLTGKLYIETRGVGEWKSITTCKLCKKDAIPAVFSNAVFCCDLPSSPYVHEADGTLRLNQQEGANGKHA